MKATLLALAVLAASAAIASAVDEVCVQRKLLGLPVHWPNPKDCGSFYRCTNKNVKRELLCPTGKQYNARTGRCAPLGRKVCKLSLLAPLEESTSPCANEVSGTYVADANSCRGFNICNDNLAYPQKCKAGSMFNTTISACVPDTNTECWENLCLAKDNGVYLPNEDNCYSFYICSSQDTVAQDCPSGSYFDKEALNCRPGVCPSDGTTAPTSTETPTTTPCNEETTTAATTPCKEVTTTPATTTCKGETTTPVTTTCKEETTTPATTTCKEETTEEVTTSPIVEVSTPCSEETTEEVTTSPIVEVSTPCSEETTEEVTTSPIVEVSTPCSEETTEEVTKSPIVEVSTPCSEETTEEVTTSPIVEVSTPCSEETTEEVTTSPIVEVSTPCTEETTEEVTTSPIVEVSTPCSEETTEEVTTSPIVEVSTPCTEETTEEVTTSPIVEVSTTCSEETTEEVTTSPIVEVSTPCSEETTGEVTTSPIVEVSTPCTEETTEEVTTSPIVEVSTPCTEETTEEVTTSPIVEVSTPCSEETTEEVTTSPIVEVSTPCTEETTEEVTTSPIVEVSTPCTEETTEEVTTSPIVEVSTPCSEETTEEVTTSPIVEVSTPCTEETTEEVTTSPIVEVSTTCSEETTEEVTTSPIVEVSTPCTEETTEEVTTSPIVEVSTPCSEETTEEVTTSPIVEVSTPCSEETTEEVTTSPIVDVNTPFTEETTEEVTTSAIVEVSTPCSEETTEEVTTSPIVEVSTPCSEETTVAETTTPVVDVPTTPCTEKTTTPPCTNTPSKCDATKCKGADDLHSFPAQDTNIGYCVCINAVPEYRECADNAIYDATLNVCVAQSAALHPVTCPGGYVDGDMVAHSQNSQLFFICFDGELIETSCGNGNYYDKTKKSCVPVLEVEEEQQSGRSRSKRNAILTETTDECCPGKVIPHPTDCSKMLVCYNGELKEESCQDGYYFNEEAKECIKDVNNVCSPKCVDGAQTENPEKCTSYNRCCNGDWVTEDCSEGQYFNSKTNACEEDVNNVCIPKCVEGSQTENPEKCTSYNRCVKGDWVTDDCSEGQYFNSKTNACEEDVNNVCIPKCIEGSQTENPEKCTSYNRCCNGDWVTEDCSEGQYFNPKTNACEEDVNNVCIPKCVEGSQTENPEKCTSYNRCVKGDWVTEDCSEGQYFNSKTNACEEDVNNVCIPKCIEGSQTENPEKCTSYNRCCNGDWVTEDCSEGQYFNSKTNACEEDVNNVCIPKCVEGSQTENPEKCTSYNRCVKGDWVTEDCSEGQYFNSKTNACEEDVNNVCIPKCIEGSQTENPEKCTSYNRCCNGDWVTEDCSEGQYFNPKTNACEEDVNNVCIPKCVEGSQTENPEKCTSYNRCVKGDWVTEDCNEGQYFNPKTNACEEDVNNVCIPKCVEGSQTENPEKCTSYNRCCNGDWVAEDCSEGQYFNPKTNACEEDVNNVCIPKCVEGSQTENPEKCTSYNRCVKGDWVTEDCSEGQYFNSKTNACEEDVNNVCIPKCVEGTYTQNPANCSSYNRCCNGDWVTEDCSEGQYFNSKTNACEEDVNNVCIPKCVEGSQTENTEKCTSYNRCCNGDWVAEDCSEGQYFNSKTNACEEDVNNVCIPKCVEGSQTENPEKCTSYNRCCNGDWVTEDCSEGQYFNSKTNTCEEDVNNVCIPKCVEGSQTGNPEKCTSYNRCCNGDWVAEDCNEGQYFNPKTNACEEDVNNVCIPKCVEGSQTENPEKCTSYNRCCNGDWVTEDCSEGQYFNSKTNTCEEDVNNVCIPKCVEGSQTENPEKCTSYNRCCNGDWVAEDCNEGQYFNPKTNACEEDVNNVCIPKCVEGSQTENPEKCTSYNRCCNGDWVAEDCNEGQYFNPKTNACEEDVNNVCIPKCVEGTYTQNPANCSSYNRCCNGDWVTEDCSEGQYFNSKTNACEEDVNNVCLPPSSPKCVEGTLTQNPANCSSYYRCCSGDWVTEDCSEGQYFDPKTSDCEEDIDNICWIKESDCTCTGGYKDGEFLPSESDCDKFYVCSDGELILQDCGFGQYFDNRSQTCLPDTQNICWINLCANQTDGDMVANPKQCNTFYLCNNGVSTIHECPTGQWFNPAESACQPDLDAVCYNPCADEVKITVLPHPSCNKFYWCNGKHTMVGTCNIGGFNVSLGSCDPTKSCSTNECEGKEDYYTFADPESKTNFYYCLNGVPILDSCENGTEFNGEVCAHVSDPDCDGDICNLSDNYESYPTINGDNSSFCMCIDGYATKHECPSEYEFNAEKGICISSAPCDPNVCKTNEEFYVFVNNYDPNSFCLCAGNEAVVVKCPSGAYNPYTSSCTNVEISEQCNQQKCRGQNDAFTYPSDNSTLNGFCRCESEIGVFVDCPEETVYDAPMGLCKLNNINCDSSKCVGVADNTKLPALTTNEGYCECVAGTATYYNCENSGEFDATKEECVEPICDSNQCIGAPDNTAFEATGTTTGFCICEDGKAKYEDCPAGGTFNNIKGTCKLPLKNCEDSMCEGQSDNVKLPALFTVNGYCMCLAGQASYEDCPNKWVFDEESSSCKGPIEDVCDITYCNDPSNAGLKYPSLSTVSGYCECSATGPIFEYCPEGDIFDATSLKCSPSPASQCDLSLCASATPDNGYSIPAKNNSASFCFCSGPDHVMLLNCPDGKYYSEAQSLCVSSLEDVDNDSCTCVGAYHEGDFIGHPYNQQMFYVCENKQLHERNCGNGRIFSTIINQCVKTSHLPAHHPRKRSVDVDELFCIDNEKRSVPSNCSQYEVCVNQMWKRQTCTDSRYYNPEQKKCLEPRDDTICEYAKVTMLPACSADMEHSLHRGRTCQQYFRCQKGKWHLRSCGKAQYYNEHIATCMPHDMGNSFNCTGLQDVGAKDLLQPFKAQSCQHLAVRPYEQNCAMYLMCLEDQWWYHYCPLGMYFNRSLNYCIPDNADECPHAIKTSPSISDVEDFVQESCPREGLLRPSALACNRYYICIKGEWLQQQCAFQEFYDVEHSKCSPDTEGVCSQLLMDCVPQEKRNFPLNCSAYEECSSKGKWHRMSCTHGEIFDELLQRCVPNDGICSARGLKRVCYENEMRSVGQNCTQFYYCNTDNWALGSCLQGHMYLKEKGACVPHSMADNCTPLRDVEMHIQTHLYEAASENENLCEGQVDGTSVAHPTDCSRYFICVTPSRPYELQCSVGSFYDSSMGYCRPNDGTCRLELTGVCANVTDGSLVAHPTDCQAYYQCSTLTGQQLVYCPEGQYYHKYTRQCRVDHGECKGAGNENNDATGAKCLNATHGTLLPHERYCNVYYACVKGLAIPVECPDHYLFNVLLGKCLYDSENQCQDGHLVNNNQTAYSCGDLSDGSYIADRKDCTRYYICSAGQAQPKKCSGSTYFDAEQLLCVPDDGSCPYVDDDEPNQHPVPPDPIVCEGKHGYLMPDPLNCNNFYVCINSKLRHERCYDQHFFNTTSNQCQAKPTTNENNNEVTETPVRLKQAKGTSATQQCTDLSLTSEQICEEYPDGATIADQGDCRLYVTCQEDDDPISQRCRNGESYDSLLGFCRQNDGTCLLENGKRAGECSDRHGQLARDTNHCRQYFTCINGQKIAQTCQQHEYFSKSQNKCMNDTLNACNPEEPSEEPIKQAILQSCHGLSESVLYPYTHDNCRSYFQCVKGIAKVHQCADDLYFDPIAIKCVKERTTECVMPQQSMQRTQDFKQQTYDQLCLDRVPNQIYPNVENKCRSYYTCRGKGEIIHELCPLGMAYDKIKNSCVPENTVNCI